MNEKESKYDVIVIGSGAGGLSVGACLAKAGKKVVVFERNKRPGGNCSSFAVDGYTFDFAVHQLTGFNGQGFCGRILDGLGIKDNLKFFKVDPFMVLEMPDAEIEIPSPINELENTLSDLFPAHGVDIRKFLEKMISLRQDVWMTVALMNGKNEIIDEYLKGIGRRKKLTYPFNAFYWYLNSFKTGKQLLEHHFKDERLISVLGSYWPYLGLPPSRMSGLMQGLLICVQHIDQTYYPKGSSSRIADEFVALIRRNGGEVHLETPVEKLIVNNNYVEGVRLEDGRWINGKIVVSNADALHTFTQLIDRKQVKEKYMRRLRSMKPSVGPFRMFLGLDINLNKSGLNRHEYMFYNSYDHEQNFKELEKGIPSVLSVYSPSYLDSDFAPEGHSTLILNTFFPWKTERSWERHGDEIGDEMISIVERRLPELRKHIVVKRVFTPADLKVYSNVAEGAMYGWANSPDQVFHRRLPRKTPFKNLYLAGHWTVPGTGVSAAVISGWLLAKELVEKL